MGVRKKQRNQNLGLGILFLFLVAFLILLSFGFKLAAVFRDSSFDGNNRFTLAVVKSNPQVVTFSPKDRSIYILNLNKPSDKNLGRLLEVPIDANISSEALVINKSEVASNMFSLLFNLRDKETNITPIDVFRLYLFSQTVKEDSIEEETLNAYDLSDIQSVTLSNFIDPKILDEKLRIEVINATDIPGLANRLASYITNMGGNVILISTDDKIVKESEIKYFGDRTYTVSKLKRLLGFKDIKIDKKNTISDVIITIGQKEVKALPF